jgi:hypothetical protein
MKANKYISEKEFKVMLFIAFLTSAFAFAGLTTISVKSYNDRVAEKQMELEAEANDKASKISFGIYSFERTRFFPFFCFAALFIFITLLKTKRFFLSAFLTLFNFCIFVYELFLSRVFLLNTQDSNFSFIERLLLIGNAFYYLTFLLVSILLFWQISILLRMLIKSFPGKIELP